MNDNFLRAHSSMVKQASVNDIAHANDPPSRSEHYRNHQLTFSLINDVCIGEVFKKTEKLAYCEALDLESARQYCRQIVDESLAEDMARNSHSEPSLQNLTHALHAIQAELDIATKHLLREHLKENNAPIESECLKKVGGFSSTTDVMFAYAHFARLLSDALCYVPPHQHSGQDAYLSMAIVTHEPDSYTHCQSQTHRPQGGLAISLCAPIFNALVKIDKV